MASKRPPHGHGIENEPQFAPPSEPTPATSDSAAQEAKAEQRLRAEARKGGSSRHHAQQSVFEEPFQVTSRHDPNKPIDADSYCPECGYNRRGSTIGAPCSECGHVLPTSYAQWLNARIAKVSLEQTWIVTLLAAALGGPLAIFGALWAGSGPLGIIVFGPLAEEIMKVGAVAVIVETKPYLFRFRGQIIFAALLSALGFAVIENLIYLNIYIANPTPGIIWWRWIVCTLLHTGCTAIAVIGVVKVWQVTMREGGSPDLGPALRWIIAAVVLHGMYNAFAVVLALTTFRL